MPPKAKITKENLLQAALEITRESGFAAVNARSLAERLGCSTQPVFTCYKNMEELKAEFLGFAYGYYKQYVSSYAASRASSPALVYPLSYIAFALEETALFRLIFVDEVDLHISDPKHFYDEPDNEARAVQFAAQTGISPERARAVFLDLFLYCHGIAVLAAAKNFTMDGPCAKRMVRNFLAAFLAQEPPGSGAGTSNENPARKQTC